MIKVSEALTITRKKIETILEIAELTNGLGLSDTELNDKTKTFYWYIANTNKVGSLQATYIVYNIPTLPPTKHGDGAPLIRRPVVIIDIYTKNRIIDELLTKIDVAFIEGLRNCEVVSISYSVQEKRFVYQLSVSLDVVDEPDDGE